MSGTFVMMMMANGGVAEQPIDGQTGVWLKQGVVTLSSAMKMTGAVVSSGQVQFVYLRGAARQSELTTWGGLHVSSGGTALSCTASGGSARIWVSSGGLASAVSIISGGQLNVYGGVAKHCIGLAGGNIFVSGNGTAFNCSNYWGLNVQSGGTAFGGTVFYRLYVSSGGTALNNTVVGEAGVYAALNAMPGGYASGVVYAAPSGGVTISAGGSMSDVVMSLGVLNQSAGGYAENVVLHSGASHAMRGVASNIAVSSAGRLTVYSGGSALAVTSNAGAIITVQAGGYIEYA